MSSRGTKLLLLFILASMLLTACNIKNKESSEIKKYGFQPPIEQLHWGMSLADIEKTLSMKDGVDGVVYSYEKPCTTITLKDKIKRFGYEATVVLTVNDKIDEEWFPYKSSYLYEVKLIYNKINGSNIKDNITKKYSTGTDSIDFLKNNCTTWYSEDKVKDVKSNDKKALISFWDILNAHNNSKNLPFASVTKENNESINELILVYTDQGAVLTYKGDTAVQIYQAVDQE